MDKKTILLIGHNSWQERSLTLMLRLAGYEPRVVDDSLEAINIVKTMQEAVHSIVLPAYGNQRTLDERLDAFDSHEVNTDIVLVGVSNQDLTQCPQAHGPRGDLRLSSCTVEKLLDCLGQ